MFNLLIESRPRRQKMAGGTLFSIIFHGTLGAAAVIATASAGIASDKSKAEKIQFVEMKKEAPKPKPKEPPAPPPKDVVVKAPPPKGFQVLRAPVEIPIKIPDIDLSRKVTDEADFSGKGVKGGVAKGVEGGTPQVIDPGQTYFDFQVEKQVSQILGTGSPRYPDALRSSGVEGEVQAQFVVNEEGRAEPGSFKVIKATNDLFASAVRSALPNMRFYAAEVGGKKVKQLVQQSFQFKLDR
ncbi:MAG: energy transducer TonB [Gemmatimonadaceae bacterium]|nr:energy transducer TonB [Gemmatimonadaceae bacterium]